MSKLNSFQDLEIWKVSHSLVLDVYALTKSFPDSERYGLISQMRRAAVSVPANIAEGFKRRSVKDKIHFYNMAQTSLEEVRYYFILGQDLCYLIQYQEQAEKIEQISRMFTGIIKSLEGRTN